ncbi:unnamed protein product [Mucor hiemalis]
MSKSKPTIDRLAISGINCVDASEDLLHIPSPLNADIRNRAIYQGKRQSFHNNINEKLTIERLDFNSYQSMQTHSNRETDYKIEYVTPFINSVFNVDDRFQLHWYNTSHKQLKAEIRVYWGCAVDFYSGSNMSTQHRRTSDAMFVQIGGLEIGALEVKPYRTQAVDIDNGIVRLGDKTKKMPHRKVVKAKSEKEFATFGVITSYSSTVEFYIHQYHPSQPTTTETTTPTTSEEHK